MTDNPQFILPPHANIFGDEPAPPPQCNTPRAYGFWATLGITIGAILAAIALGILLGIFGSLSGYGNMLDYQALAMLLMGFPVIAIVGLSAYFRGGFLKYCAIDRPSLRNSVHALAALGALFLIAEVASRAFGLEMITEWQKELLRNATQFQFCIYMFAIVIMAPLWEEILFRGFMYRGWAASFMGTAGAIAIPCIIWTLLHAGQYEWGILAIVMLAGLVIGVVRWKTGSLTLCILMHFMNNLVAVVQTLFAIEML